MSLSPGLVGAMQGPVGLKQKMEQRELRAAGAECATALHGHSAGFTKPDVTLPYNPETHSQAFTQENGMMSTQRCVNYQGQCSQLPQMGTTKIPLKMWTDKPCFRSDQIRSGVCTHGVCPQP